MESFSYSGYPESGDSSPRCLDVEFDNPPPWEDQQPQNYKAKFMCSYGGKIQPRPHDNQFSYVGGETKILAVDSNIKFSAMASKLSAICDADVTFKYQLPGEDLDALISVTNDDDLEHMMHEYDRLYRASAKPARMRLFLFPVVNSPHGSFTSDRDRFVETLNSGPSPAVSEPIKIVPPPSDASAAAAAAAKKVDFLFSLEKGVPLPSQPAPVAQVKYHEPVPEPIPPVTLSDQFPTRGGSGSSDRVIGSDQVEIQRQIQDLQMLQISEHHDHGGYRRKNEDHTTGASSTGGYVGGGGEFYMAKLPSDKGPSETNLPPPPTVQPHPTNFWPEKQVSGGGFPLMTTAPAGPEPPVYVIQGPAPGTYYPTAQVMRPVTAPTNQGFYTIQRMGSDVHREQPVYGTVAPPQPPLQAPLSTVSPTTLPPTRQFKVPAYSEGFGMVKPSGVVMDSPSGYSQAQMSYENTVGRQIYYTAAGGVVHAPPYQGVNPAVNVEVNRAAGFQMGQEVKVASKVSQASK